jgi:hypothetical protein
MITLRWPFRRAVVSAPVEDAEPLMPLPAAEPLVSMPEPEPEPEPVTDPLAPDWHAEDDGVGPLFYERAEPAPPVWSWPTFTQAWPVINTTEED